MSRPRLPFGWVGVIGLWLVAFHFISTLRFGHGVATFLWLWPVLGLLAVPGDSCQDCLDRCRGRDGS